MSDREQEEKEAPGKFLDRLREALLRFTEIDPESEEEKVILKDRFLTQSAPDIRRELLKWVYGPNQSLDNLLQLAQSIMVENMRKRKAEKDKGTGRSPCNGCQKQLETAREKCPKGPR